MEHALGLHLQRIPDEGKLMRYLFSLNRPLGVFIVPSLLDKTLRTESGELIWNNIHSEDNNYPDETIQFLGDNKDNPHITWIQEGYLHCCIPCFRKREENVKAGRGKWPGCYHEHVCVSDGTSQRLYEQNKNIEKGLELIFDKTGIRNISGYLAANHLGNSDTINAVSQNEIGVCIVRNGFDYLTKHFPRESVKGLIGLPAYVSEDSGSKGLIVVPESIIGEGKKSPLIGAYYDRLLDDEKMLNDYLELLDFAVPLSEIKPIKKRHKADLSEKLVYNYKRVRDWKKRLKI